MRRIESTKVFTYDPELIMDVLLTVIVNLLYILVGSTVVVWTYQKYKRIGNFIGKNFIRE